jgi:hypothetical protein
MTTNEIIVKKDQGKTITFVDKNGVSFGFVMSQLRNWSPTPKPIPATQTTPASKAVQLDIRLYDANVTINCNPVAAEMIEEHLRYLRLFLVRVGEQKTDDPRGPAKVTEVKIAVKGAANTP